jgi:hypothetical protein
MTYLQEPQMYRSAHAEITSFASLSIALLLAALLVPSPAEASPWTVRADEFVMTLESNYQSADDEFLPDGELQDFPLNGEFSAYTLSLGGRYGYTDRFEGAFRVNLKQVNFKADPFVLILPEDTGDAAAINSSIINFNRSSAGAGDVQFHGRYNFVRGLVMLTSETSVSFPTGYDRPRGTFGDSGNPSPEFLEDDVTLGDGQTDLTQSMLVGGYVPATRTFMRLDAGYRHRFGSPGDQSVYNFSIGQYIGDKVVLFAGVDGALTLFEGESIGLSFITKTPEKSARELRLEDIETIERTLDKDYLKLDAGVIFQLPEVELRASYGQIVWGTNVSRVQSVSLALVYTLEDLTQSADMVKAGGE